MKIDAFNDLGTAEAHAMLLTCCAAPQWADALLARRPFRSVDAVLTAAASTWAEASDAQALEAFTAHAVLGDVEHLRARFAGRAMTEQGQVLAADEDVLARLAEANRTYLDRFGFIFILCASGVSAEAMLAALQARIDNDRDTEIRNAAVEQGRILALRLRDLFKEASA